MKSFDVKSNIGEGLFSDDPIDVQLNFPDGTVGTFKVFAMTQDVVLELMKAGVRFDNASKDPEYNYNNFSKMINRIVHSGSWKGIKIDDSNKNRIMSHSGLAEALLNAARMLAEETVEEDTKNSES